MHYEMITAQDHLDRLSDELLLAIFERIRDARTLVGLLSLCRRFRSLVPLADSVSLSFPLPHPVPPRKPRPSFSKNPLGFLLDRILRNPIRRLNFAKSRGDGRNCFDEEGIVGDIAERLRVFGEARDVRVILPCEGGLTDKSGTFLKWRASYGSQIRSCVILGASEVRSIGESFQEKAASNGEEGPVVATTPLLSDVELKLRVVWIISCLIAASYRHYMMRKVIAGCPALRRAVVGDVRQQGKVVMGEDEVSEVRKDDNDRRDEDNDQNTTERSKVPDLKMKLWHAPSLELPRCGRVLKAATLVVITPVLVDGGNQDRHEDEILQRGIGELRGTEKEKGEILGDGSVQGQRERRCSGAPVERVHWREASSSRRRASRELLPPLVGWSELVMSVKALGTSLKLTFEGNNIRRKRKLRSDFEAEDGCLIVKKIETRRERETEERDRRKKGGKWRSSSGNSSTRFQTSSPAAIKSPGATATSSSVARERSLKLRKAPLRSLSVNALCACHGHSSTRGIRKMFSVESLCWKIAPDWRQALTLKKAAEDRITKDGIIGIGIAATAVGLLAGGLAAALARKK